MSRLRTIIEIIMKNEVFYILLFATIYVITGELISYNIANAWAFGALITSIVQRQRKERE